MAEKRPMQLRRRSLNEAGVNTFFGYWLNVMAGMWLIYPMHGHTFSYQKNVTISLCFLFISLSRGYVVRRWFTHGD